MHSIILLLTFPLVSSRLFNKTDVDFAGLLETRLLARAALTESPKVLAIRRQLEQIAEQRIAEGKGKDASPSTPILPRHLERVSRVLRSDLWSQPAHFHSGETIVQEAESAGRFWSRRFGGRSASEHGDVHPTHASQGKLAEKRTGGRFLDTDDYDHNHEDHPYPPRPLPIVAPEEKGSKFEGDIVLFDDQAEEIAMEVMHGNKTRRKRKFIAPLNRRWDSRRPVEYSFDGSHSNIHTLLHISLFQTSCGAFPATRERKIIELALEHWQNITCLDFEYKSTKPIGNRIVFTDIDGCASNVGRHPLGEPQYVSIAPECLRLGVIAHEVAHALGFWHEQSRPDRDEYVQVLWDNIDRNSKGQFLKEQESDVDNGGVPYDYGSIMHYRSKAFAAFDDLFTIHTSVRDYQKTIGQRDQLSFNDIRLMNVIYCKDRCPVELSCLRGGYTDPRKCDRCRCPDGFTGTLCEKVMSGYRANCGGEVQLGRGWLSISSPNYPEQFTEGQECSWLLQAPPRQHVEVQFIGSLDLYCKAQHSLCMDYVEVRNTTDFANTGMRYCCYSAPLGSIYSATEDMLVLFRSFYRQGRGFKGWWRDWGEWSVCSGSCGACGIQRRRRECPPGSVCRGEAEETRRCNENPCEVCPQSRYVSSPCGGFLGLLRGVRCKVEQTVYVPCPSACCSGFSQVGNKCVES